MPAATTGIQPCYSPLLRITATAVKRSQENCGFCSSRMEEICPGGAQGMIAEGVLEGADAIYGLHLWTPLPLGTIGSAPGPLMASADEFFIDITGRGGHGGMPHRTIDSIVAGAALVTALQSIVSRSVDPLCPAVVSVGTIQGGSAQNIIAERCRITGTVRAFDEETRYLIRRRIEELTASIAAAYGAESKLDYLMGYPPLVNHEAEFNRFFRVAPKALGDSAEVVHMEKLMPHGGFLVLCQRDSRLFHLCGCWQSG